jgi:hypothetical protein
MTNHVFAKQFRTAPYPKTSLPANHANTIRGYNAVLPSSGGDKGVGLMRMPTVGRGGSPRRCRW